MAEFHLKSLLRPNEVVEFPGITSEIVDLGEITVARNTHQPGWRWSKDARPIVGGEWCQARHIGIVLSGRIRFAFADGTVAEAGPDDIFEIPPGHDGWVVGSEPAVTLDWGGVRAFAPKQIGLYGRVLATILFTDVVGSTQQAEAMGDAAWGDLLRHHFAEFRSLLERFRGREVKSTGDGLLAVFDGAAVALRCAIAARNAAIGTGIRIRSGVHVGEVEIVGEDIRGIAVHEAARIMGAAGPDEIFVSQVARQLSLGAGLSFEDRGQFELKGINEPRQLFALLD